MIDVKQAIQIAKNKAAEILGGASSVEEIERDIYKGHDVWSITLGVSRDLAPLAPVARFAIDPVQYKLFLIDAETGELLAMKLREVASR